MAVRKILHIDLDAFFCSVEEQMNPALRGKAFAVGGRPDQRGVVASCSYPARKAGIRSAMPMSQALRLLPALIVVPARHHEYGKRSDAVMAILRNWTPILEQVSVDEAFLDLSDLPEDLETLAKKIQTEVQQKTGLPCSLGGAVNKLVAKIANDVGKSRSAGNGPPRAILIVPPGKEAEFLAPLPVKTIWGIGDKTANRLAELGIKTASQLAAADEEFLISQFGKFGRMMKQSAAGHDDSPVMVEHAVKSISQEITFERDLADRERLIQTLHDLSAQVAFRLRSNSLEGSTVRIKIRWPDFSTHTRQVTLAQATCQDGVIFSTACGLFDSIWAPGRPVRLIGVGVSGLQTPFRQLPLWDSMDEKERRLLTAVDEVREKFGKTAIQRGDQLKPGFSHPDGKRGQH